jgi:hypothetical protein
METRTLFMPLNKIALWVSLVCSQLCASMDDDDERVTIKQRQ